MGEGLPMVVYIAGYGRSGSTVLDMLLGMQPRVLGSGELAHVFGEWLRNGECSCGERYSHCAYWSTVQKAFSCALPGVGYDEALQATRRVESGASVSWLLLGKSRSSDSQYAKIWRGILGAMAEVGDASVIVDSSKSTRLTAGRALALTELCGLDVRVVHLVRDPRAVLWSALRGSNQKLEAGEPAQIRGSVYRTLASWIATNLGVHAAKVANRAPYTRLRYEDLVLHPTRELRHIAGALRLGLSDVIGLVEAGNPVVPAHGIAGNRLRRQGRQYLQLDEEWKAELPRHARALAVLGWPLARRYRY